jgi:uncharacterized protein (DUF1778 family)
MKKQLSLPEKARFVVSEKDQEAFFKALMNPSGPNKKLRGAAECYKEFIKANK